MPDPKVQARLAAIRARADSRLGCDESVGQQTARWGDARREIPALLDLIEALLSERDARATRYFESVKETHAADRALAKFGEEQA